MNLNETLIIAEGQTFHVVEQYSNFRDIHNPKFQLITEIRDAEGTVVKTLRIDESGQTASDLYHEYMELKDLYKISATRNNLNVDDEALDAIEDVIYIKPEIVVPVNPEPLPDLESLEVTDEAIEEVPEESA